MSDQLFEVAFSGKISEGVDVDDVKSKVGKMFSADEAKLEQLFSGKRIVIKKNVDQATATKYKTALNRAGADCEVKSMDGESDSASVAAAPVAAAVATPAATTASKPVSQEYETEYDGEVEPPPQVDPLGITGDQIEDLSASLAPVGSELQSDYAVAETPQIDTSELDVAPVGSELNTAKKEPEPPPPDISGITLEE
jgi:hypothetical protein